LHYDLGNTFTIKTERDGNIMAKLCFVHLKLKYFAGLVFVLR